MRAELEAMLGSAALDERAVRVTDIRGNLPVPSHALPRLRRGGPSGNAALLPAVWITRRSLQATLWCVKDQVAAGINPAALATLERCN